MNKNNQIKRSFTFSAVVVSAIGLSACGPKEPAYATQAEVEDIRSEIMQSNTKNAEKLQSTEYNSRTFVGNIEELQFQISDLQRQVATLQTEVNTLKQSQDPQAGLYTNQTGSSANYPLNESVAGTTPVYAEPIGGASSTASSVNMPSTLNNESSELPIISGDISGDTDIAVIESQADSGEAQVIVIEPAVEAAGADQMAMVESPELLYQKAFEALRVGEVSTAITDFNIIATEHPDHEFADDSLYWIGEAEFVSNNYGESKSAFNKLISTYPEAGQYPDALLRLGMIEAQEGNSVQAEQYFIRVISDYPQTRAGVSAQDQLKQLPRPTSAQ